MSAIDIASNPIHLGLGATAAVEPRFTGDLERAQFEGLRGLGLGPGLRLRGHRHRQQHAQCGNVHSSHRSPRENGQRVSGVTLA